MNIYHNLINVTDNIAKYNKNAQLVAATKMQNNDAIKVIMDSGKVLAAGENRVQELLEKYNNDFRWDFIGQLQTNKVKYLVDKVELIHSVDRLKLAEVINKESAKINKVQDILVQINAGRETAKGGIYLEDTDMFLQQISTLPNIRVRGMMAVAPYVCPDDQLKMLFDEVYNVYTGLENKTFCYLSMGMSNDYILALKSGANLIRVGRAIFGERKTNG